MELSRRDFFKASGVALLALTAACTPIIAGEHTDPQLPKDIATSPASTGTPYPEGIYVGGGEASLQAERDPIQIAKEVENFDNAQVDWYDKAGDLQTSESGKESGFVLLGVLNANLSDNASVNNKFGYITGPGGEEHLAQKINDNRWIVLAYKELPEPNGNVLNAFGYSSQGIFLPILSVEFTTSGEPTGSVWFFDISVNRFYKISDPENHGKPGMMALAQVENKHILVGKDLMKDNEDKKWNFVWQKDGSLTISGSDDIILYTFDKESGKWGVCITEAESAAIALFDKYGVAPDTYILTDVDGIMVGTDKETGVEIFRDGRFDISYAVKLAKKDCEPTDFKPDKWGFMQSKDKESLGIYLETLFDDSNYLISDDAWLWMYWGSIDRTRQCWGLFGSDAIVYRDETGLAQDIPIIHLTEDEVDEFTSNR